MESNTHISKKQRIEVKDQFNQFQLAEYSINLFEYLPDEMLVFMMLSLDHKSLLNIGMVSHRFNQFAGDEKVWVELLKKDYSVNYNEFLSDYSVSVPNQTTSPKLLYRFLNLFRRYNDEALRIKNNCSKPFNPDIFANPLPTVAFTFGCILSYQQCHFLNTFLSPEDCKKLPQLMELIYSLAGEHCCLAFLMFNHGSHSLPNLKIRNIAILKLLLDSHLNKFATLDLTTSAFANHELQILDFIKDAINKKALFHTLILPDELAANIGMVTYYNSFSNLETLVVKCNSTNSYQNEATSELWTVMLERTKLKKIIIQSKDDTESFIFIKTGNQKAPS